MAADLTGARAGTTTISVADTLYDRIGQILAQHREGTDGWCLACAEEGTLRFHPCPSARWARNVGRRTEAVHLPAA